ncbi:hypothetical protein PYW07_002904 [Mythimna separata]|uniref:Uncharacterized protein n=1 Tax=Mythimna separata TaxID=271217 RepID=A0AAD7YHP8_MYTSE|nr:hypothetical protein PYW07_002904 [Mythimna separata]
MLFKVFVVFSLVSHVISDSCVRYTFEEGYHEWFQNQWGAACDQFPFWIPGKYSDVDVTSQNERSTSFITPLPVFSCVASFIFAMSAGGTIDVNIYMEPEDIHDQIVILAHLLEAGGDTIVGQAINMALDPNFVAGWHTLTMTLTGSGTYKGYISIMGMKSPNSTVLIDSFRYIPPGMDASECQLYEDLPGVNHPKFSGFKG